VEADRDVGVRIFRPIFLLVSVKSDDLLFWGMLVDSVYGVGWVREGWRVQAKAK
jgi:hypothetical protein